MPWELLGLGQTLNWGRVWSEAVVHPLSNMLLLLESKMVHSWPIRHTSNYRPLLFQGTTLHNSKFETKRWKNNAQNIRWASFHTLPLFLPCDAPKSKRSGKTQPPIRGGGLPKKQPLCRILSASYGLKHPHPQSALQYQPPRYEEAHTICTINYYVRLLYMYNVGRCENKNCYTSST